MARDRADLGSLAAQDLTVLADDEGVLLFDGDSEVVLDFSVGSRAVASVRLEAAGLELIKLAKRLSAPPIPLHPRPGDPGVPAWWT